MYKIKRHNLSLYNILLTLSRNINFYKKIGLADKPENRLYLMFIHFSIMLIIFKKKGIKFKQNKYDELFHSIEYNFRETGMGDVNVNKKMKELNKIFYDILLKLELKNSLSGKLKLNHTLILKYFIDIKDEKRSNYLYLEDYFANFYDFCNELSPDNMIEGIKNFTY